MDPRRELTQPLLRLQFGPRLGPRLKPLTDSLDTDGEHVVCVADQTRLNRLPNQLLRFRVEAESSYPPLHSIISVLGLPQGGAAFA